MLLRKVDHEQRRIFAETDAMQISIQKGATFCWTLRPETAVQKYIPITAITMTTDGVQITATAHGLLEGWRCRVTRCKGMTRLNTVDEDHPRASDFFIAHVVDVNTIKINSENSTGDSAYTGGGVLQYGVPMDLTGCTIRSQIRPSVNSSIILLDLGLYATVNAALCQIDFQVPDTITTALVGTSGGYSIEIEDSSSKTISTEWAPAIFVPEGTR